MSAPTRLIEARDWPEVLAALGPDVAPGPAELLEWWPECPDEAREAARTRLRRLAAWIAEECGSQSFVDAERAEECDFDRELRATFPGRHVATWRLPEGDPAPSPDRLAERWADPSSGRVPRDAMTLATWLSAELSTGRSVTLRAEMVTLDPLGVHAAWVEARGKGYRGPHPYAPIADAWADREPSVPACTRPDPLLPAVLVEVGEDEADRLAFGGLVPVERPAQLPLFPDVEADGPRVALLEMADRSGVQTMAQGRGAPLPLRLAVAMLLATPYDRRREVARVVVTVRQLRAFLFDDRFRSYGDSRPGDWDRTRDALRTLARCAIPTDPRGGAWFPFRLCHLPGRDAELGDLLVMDVEAPPGSRAGPVVDREAVARLGRVSGPGLRAFLAVHTVQWVPGRTQRPVPRDRRGRHGWSANPNDYEVLTREDRRRLAFGPDAKHRTTRQQDGPWTGTEGLEVVSKAWTCQRTGRRGWLVVPAAAAERVSDAIAGGLTQPGNKSDATGEFK